VILLRIFFFIGINGENNFDKLVYRKGESAMVILSHNFLYQFSMVVNINFFPVTQFELT